MHIDNCLAKQKTGKQRNPGETQAVRVYVCECFSLRIRIEETCKFCSINSEVVNFKNE